MKTMERPKPAGPEPAESPEPVERAARTPLSREEKRLLLAEIVRINPLDCLDDSGAFDLARARRVLPDAAVQRLIIRETTRRDGTVTRTIDVRLVDKIRAMKLDDFLLQQEEEDRADARSLALKKKLRDEQDKEIQRRLEVIEEEEEHFKVEAEIRAMKVAEENQMLEHLKAKGFAGAPLLPVDQEMIGYAEARKAAKAERRAQAARPPP
jgi:hypothetical protein